MRVGLKKVGEGRIMGQVVCGCVGVVEVGQIAGWGTGSSSGSRWEYSYW